MQDERANLACDAHAVALHQVQDDTYLLDTGNVPGNVVDRYGVLDRESVGLALDPRLVDQNTGIRSETYKIGCHSKRQCRDLKIDTSFDLYVPAKAKQTWSSSIAVFRMVLGSWS